MELISLAICEVENSFDELKHGLVDFWLTVCGCDGVYSLSRMRNTSKVFYVESRGE